MRQFSRRAALALGAGGAALGFMGLSSGAQATPEETAAAVAKFTGGKKPVEGKISLQLPDIAENGNIVPLAVAIDAPMTADDYVSEVLVVADGNPRPGVLRFHFTPMSGRAEASTRIRLATTQNVIALAKTSKGALYSAQKHVKVTIGGCGG